ncbi:hypothetical protein [Halorussus lipolyticus]|uniref:hypothetical protein n=1 Tax=Halorussus lipolyticus TaxID=3034024 RepID=UPI0023E7DA8E|nr:hypothetical protein [Halorussus sp. DT80]
MSSVSNADSSSETAVAESEPTASDETDSSSVLDKLDTAATLLRVSFVVVALAFTLIPVVGVLAGWAPFDPPPRTPYLALVGVALVGTVALVAAEMWDV